MLQLSGAGQRCRFRPDASSVGAWGFSQACPRTLAESGAVGCSRELTFHRQMCPEGLPGISLPSVDSGALPGLSAPDGAPKLDLSGGEPWQVVAAVQVVSGGHWMPLNPLCVNIFQH
jgi:hypothetical protein